MISYSLGKMSLIKTEVPLDIECCNELIIIIFTGNNIGKLNKDQSRTKK